MLTYSVPPFQGSNLFIVRIPGALPQAIALCRVAAESQESKHVPNAADYAFLLAKILHGVARQGGLSENNRLLRYRPIVTDLQTAVVVLAR